MLRHIGEWLGFTALEQDVRDVVDQANMRLALIATLPLMLVQLFLVNYTYGAYNGGVIQASSHNIQNLGWILQLSSVLIVSAAVVLLACATRYRRSKSPSHTLACFGVHAHASLSALAGILLSMVDTRPEGGTYLMLTILVGSLCVFAYKPVFSIALTIGSFVIYDFVGSYTVVELQVPTLVSSTLWLCVLLSSIFRYHAECHHARAELAAKQASNRDFLTGMGNRAALRADVENMQDNVPYIVAIMDIDDFKYYNDAFGHDAGDKVLKAYAASLKKCFSDCASYRYGGDEFLVVCEHMGEKEFKGKVERFRTMIANIEVDDSAPAVTSSLGYALGKAAGWDMFQENLRTADERLFFAKRQGKNRSVGPVTLAGNGRSSQAMSKHSIDPSIGRMYKLDDVDPLTKLSNINSFLRRAQILLNDEERVESGILIAFFDLEGFSGYNERYGFEAGDKLLCAVADLLREKFPSHLIARIEADRFAVAVYPDLLAVQQDSLHDEIRLLGGGVRIELKIGICQPKLHEGLSASVACDRAQEAAESIKGRRDLFVRVYDDELRLEIERRRYIVDNIEEALEQGRIEVYLQPIVRGLNGRTCALEALSRWNDAEYGLISPGVYISVLEEARLIHLHDLYIVNEVAKNIGSLIRRGAETLPVSVNLSRVDFDLADMPREVDGILKSYGVPRELICIEITESAVSEGGERLARMVEQFKSYGFAVWMDDFGSGYSSLNTLKDLDFDLIKIDMGFIQNLDASSSSRVIFSSIVHMAKLLGLHTLVEGVETEEQLSFVRSTGCELVQGYLFSRPVEAKKLERDILSSDLPIEKSDEHEYYTKLGMLNPQSSTPLVFAGDEGTKIEASKLALMLAIVELEGGMLRTLHASEGFGQAMVGIGLSHILDGGLAPDESPRAAAIHSLINVARTSGGIESLELMKESTRYQVRARYVASMRGRDSFAVTISRSGSSLFSNASASESTLLSDMLYMYDQVDIFDLETGAAQNFFRCNAEYPYGYEGKDVAEMAARYVEENVHPQDRAGFVAFENVATAERRLAEQHTTLLTETFRIKSLADGKWRWKIFILVPVTFDGRRCLLSATRDANLRNVHKIANASSLSV